MTTRELFWRSDIKSCSLNTISSIFLKILAWLGLSKSWNRNQFTRWNQSGSGSLISIILLSWRLLFVRFKKIKSHGQVPYVSNLQSVEEKQNYLKTLTLTKKVFRWTNEFKFQQLFCLIYIGRESPVPEIQLFCIIWSAFSQESNW